MVIKLDLGNDKTPIEENPYKLRAVWDYVKGFMPSMEQLEIYRCGGLVAKVRDDNTAKEGG